MRPTASLLLACAVSAPIACAKGGAPSSHDGGSQEKVSPRPPPSPLRAGETREVPTGAFQAGSNPGEPGRRPEVEPRLLKVELGSFRIDRLPYPNDPTTPPRTGVTREEAARLCGERAARLCTELEWERACKGPESTRFVSGDAWEPRCATEPKACASGFDVLSLGAGLREWTASDIAAGTPKALAALRGAAASAPPDAHRCAARSGAAADSREPDLGFRCCSGPPNARELSEPVLGPAFKKVKLSAERLTALLAADAATRDLAKDVKYFREPDSAETVIARGPGDKKGFLFTTTPLGWSPVAGTDFLVASARAGENTSFVVAFYALGGDAYRLAASFIMKNEPGPVALAYSDDIRPRLHFSTCWGCPGETGKVIFRRPERVAIVAP